MLIPTEGVAFSLKHAASGLFLAIKDTASYAGAEAVLTERSDDHMPQWLLRSEQSAHYLINASTSDMCLNVAYERMTIGGNLQQWSCNGGASELWTLVPSSSGNFVLLNRNSHLVAGPVSLSVGSSITQMRPLDEKLAEWTIVGHDLVPNSLRSSVTAASRNQLPVARDAFSAAPMLMDEIIYNIYVPIYSLAGNLGAVTQDLPRIAGMGISTLLLMPIHPMGVPTGRHPAIGSPYAVADFYAVDSSLGQLSDFASLVEQAHDLGLKVIMDVVLNHTAWSHPLITQRPDCFVHNSRKKKGPDSIAQAFWFEDVAQLDYKSGTFVQEYISSMLVWWMNALHVDGFRFDTVDNPYGDDRMIPASTWAFIGQTLRDTNPKAILFGECCNPDLSLKPFNIDYTNYSLQPAIVSAIKSQNASGLSRVVDELQMRHPPGMLHASIMQTWDMDLDLRMYGGPDPTLAAATLIFTIQGVPMLFAGQEAGNDRGGVNTHTLINWNGPLASRFRTFYTNLAALRRMNVALRRGSTTWLRVSGAGVPVIAFIRTSENRQSLVAINYSASFVQGNVNFMVNTEWKEITPPGAANSPVHPTPPTIRLGPWDFTVFTRAIL